MQFKPTQYILEEVDGYNGGGDGGSDFKDQNVPENSGGGGGATDIRLISGLWDSAESLNSRIMVASGGAGGLWKSQGYNGGLINSIGHMGTYQFGKGSNGKDLTDSWGIAGSGGGGGYFGGKRWR